MPARLPNLFRTDPKNASRYYQLFLAKLLIEDRHEELISMCRRIRRMATPEYDQRNLQVFYLMEIDALCELRRFDVAWRQLRAAERLRWGRSLDLQTHEWQLKDIPVLTMDYAPLLYFRKRYEFGRHLLEEAISLMVGRPKRGYEALLAVSRGEQREPANTYGVRLSHFYKALGEDLDAWKDWGRLVDGLHRQLFTIAKISRQQLQRDPTLVHAFVGRLITEQNRRGGVVNRGQDDLIQTPEEVREAQEEHEKEMQAFQERTAEQRKNTHAKIQHLFGAFLRAK